MSNAPMREVARRVFAREFNDATYSFKESDDERADVGEDSEYWQGRIVDPNGDTFFAYAGQYQPDAAAMLRELEPPAYVAIVGKPRTYETDEGDVNVSIRPESITRVDESVRDRWVVETAERTIERIRAFDDDETNEYAEMAREHYDLPVENYRRAAVEALESLEDEETAAEANP
ncbi:MAG: DNA-binding protein [Halapricum sp.]